MEFVDDNLTKEDIRESLELMKQGIEFYKAKYHKKTIISTIDHNPVNIVFYKYNIPHLLGFDINAKNTWLEYISHKGVRTNSLEWLEEFVNSVEFIEYMILTKKEPKLVNFAKIKFKSINFCSMDFQVNPAFFFKIRQGRNVIDHIGVFNSNDNIISFRLVKDKRMNFCTYIPKSLYVYDTLSIHDINSFIIPSEFFILRGRKKIDFDLYSSDSIEELKQKIKTFKG